MTHNQCFLEVLVELNLEEYSNNINPSSPIDLSLVTDADLERLGVNIRLHRVKILNYLKRAEPSQSQVSETDVDLSEFHSQAYEERFDLSVNTNECIAIKAISGYMEGLEFKIGESGARIGRSSQMEIVIPDGFVSRKHCEIKYNKERNQFFICDTGSTTGTYIRTRSEHILEVGCLFQVGQCEFKVLNIVYSLSGYPMSIEIIKYEGPNPMPLIVTTGCIIGRSRNCEVSIPQDTIMSQEHAEIFVKNGHFYLKDLNSRNFIWIRLSPEGEFSEDFSLCQGDYLKVGAVAFTVSDARSSKRICSERVCKECFVREINTEMMPCGHLLCLECASRLRVCTICQQNVQEIIRR